MAKLSAHGYEVARLVKSTSIAGTDYIVTLSFRSDGHIMRKLKALNIHGTTYGGSPHHTYPWKLYKRTNATVAKQDRAATVLSIARRWRDQSAEAGHLLEYSENAAMAIDNSDAT